MLTAHFEDINRVLVISATCVTPHTCLQEFEVGYVRLHLGHGLGVGGAPFKMLWVLYPFAIGWSNEIL